MSIETKTKTKIQNLMHGERLCNIDTSGNNKERRKKINLRMLNYFFGLIIAVLGITYVGGVNGLSIKGFELQDMKKKQIELKRENDSLKIEMTSLGSYNNLSQKISKLGMIKAGQMEYVGGGVETVAMK